MGKSFASSNDVADRTATFSEIAEGIFAYTTEGDPNTGVIVGDHSVLVFDTQATPAMARNVISHIREVTDKPIKHLVLSHHHGVRVLGASAYGASEIIASQTCLSMIHERGKEAWTSEMERFPRLYRDAQSIPGLTYPTVTFAEAMTLHLGRRVELLHLGRAHTAGDIVLWVPDAGVLFAGDAVEVNSAVYCGDAHLKDWDQTLAAIAELRPKILLPGRGEAQIGADASRAALEFTRGFVGDMYGTVAPVAAKGGGLKAAMQACRAVCDPKYSDCNIYEHCLPFNVSRAYDEALGIDWPRIWTAERDRELWELLGE